MKKAEVNIATEILIQDYQELKSSYKVAKKHNISATAVKRILKDARVIRTQSEAAKEKDISHLKYVRTNEHKENLSELGKLKTGDKNPFFGKKHTEETKIKLSKAAKERTEKRNPNYKDGSYQRRPRDFKIAEFTRLRKFVFNRDDYTCKYCKGMSGHLHAHHKIPYWVLPEAFLDTFNLVTVCTECHFKHAHLSDWTKFDVEIIEDTLLEKYKLDRERLNELTGKKKP